MPHQAGQNWEQGHQEVARRVFRPPARERSAAPCRLNPKYDQLEKTARRVAYYCAFTPLRRSGLLDNAVENAVRSLLGLHRTPSVPAKDCIREDHLEATRG
jgi:hypothetical protein